MIAEDSFYENFQFLFYFSGSLVAFFCSRLLWRSGRKPFSILHICISISLFFVAGEEISWGQRIFGLSTPEIILRDNDQKELSLHNLHQVQSKLINGYIIVGLAGASLWLIIRILERDKKTFLGELAPDWYLSLYFLIPGILYSFFQLSPALVDHFGLSILRVGDFVIWRDQEPAETLLSLGVLLFLFIRLVKLKETRNQ
jgi:hypothetical protein